MRVRDDFDYNTGLRPELRVKVWGALPYLRLDLHSLKINGSHTERLVIHQDGPARFHAHRSPFKARVHGASPVSMDATVVNLQTD
jgi:hypothetical protein